MEGAVFGATGPSAGGALGGVFGIANPGPGRGSSSASAPRISRFNCRRVRLKIGDLERSSAGTSCCLSVRYAILSSLLSRICASKEFHLPLSVRTSPLSISLRVRRKSLSSCSSCGEGSMARWIRWQALIERVRDCKQEPPMNRWGPQIDLEEP